MKYTHEKRRMIWLPVAILALFVIFVGCVAVIYQRYQALFLMNAPVGTAGNPILRSSDDGGDYAVSVLDGVDIANARRDSEKLLGETKKMDWKFRDTVRKLNDHGEEAEAETLLRRDAFAVRRLKILRKIEKAETVEERKSLVESLRMFSTQ